MPIEQLTILAPGLIGGSVARAVRARGVAGRIVIWARKPETRRAVTEAKLGDCVVDTPEAAVKDSDFVVIAAPVDAIVSLTRQIAPYLSTGATVTDVGSVKSEIVREGQAALAGGGAHFVGAHPMAGSEKTGWEYGNAALFASRTCFVTPRKDTDKRALKVVSNFWSSLGGNVVIVDPEAHDRIVAHISHLPQVVASVLCAFLSTQDPGWRDFAGGGLRDTTRIAASDPALWTRILEQNRPEVLKAVEGLRKELEGFESALKRSHWPEVTKRLERGRAYRKGIS
jgi:cyclohexadieny/prephenate dehydrogenase